MFGHVRTALGVGLGLAILAGAARADDGRSSLKSGKPDLKSISALAFGPQGILFVGDSQGGAVFAIDTGDATAASTGAYKVQDLGGKIAGALGVDAKQMLITDMAVNPVSGNAYLSVSRGKGPDATPVLVKVDRSEKVEVFPLDNVKFAKAELVKPATAGRSKQDAITQLQFINGRLYIAGLSSEEFASRLRSLPFPFEGGDVGTNVEIFHGAHGKLETNSPIRTFTAFDIKGEANLLASYTCTPLVRIPLEQLKPGARIKGTTVAELGNRNRPIDMVVYQKDGKDYCLMANSSRGLMKVELSEVDAVEPITKRISDKAGLKYQTLASYKNSVQQLSRLDKENVLMLVQDSKGGLSLETIALP
jgi:hypothetical protein